MHVTIIIYEVNYLHDLKGIYTYFCVNKKKGAYIELNLVFFNKI